MDGIAASPDNLPNQEILAANLTCFNKLEGRVNSGKSADILCADVDGTLYKKVLTDEHWGKKGNNSAAFQELEEKSIPHVLISGRPDFDTATDQEMSDLGVTPADVAIAGAGTIVYWRDDKEKLVLDQEFLSLMKSQKVIYGGKEEFLYNPEKLQPLLGQEIALFKQFGVKGLKIDTNQGAGFNTIDISNMSFDQLGKLVSHLRAKFSGIKVEFSEDLEKLDENHFSGWMQIVPASGGKDKALRFVLEKIAARINPFNAETAKKPVAHIIGDAAIDILMLAMGAGEKDPYSVRQYALGNLTAYTRAKLERVKTSLSQHKNPDWRQAHLTILEEQASIGVAKVVNSI